MWGRCVNEEIGKHVTDLRVPLRRAKAAAACRLSTKIDPFFVLNFDPWPEVSLDIVGVSI